MSYHGDYALGATFNFKFTTIDDTGLASALTSGALSAYPGNSVTQLTAGLTLSADFDSITGLNNVNVVASSGNGYATATDYAVVLSAGTVDGVSVAGYVIGHFSIENRSGLRPTTAGRTLTIESDGMAHADVKEVGGTAQTANDIGADVNEILTDTGTTLQAELDAIQAAVITNAAGVDIAADIIALKAETAAILADTDDIGVAGAGLTAINLPDQTMNITGNITGNLSGSVGSVTGAVGSVTGAVGSVTGAVGSVAGNVDGSVASVTAAVTVDDSTPVEVNVKQINDVPITGDGSATPFTV